MGLVDKLKMAATQTVVENLLAEGTRFSDASGKTKRRWRYVATRRLKELQPQPKKQVEKKDEPLPQGTHDTETGRVVNRHKKYHKT